MKIICFLLLIEEVIYSFVGGNMNSKIFPNFIRLLTVISIITSIGIPIYTYFTGRIVGIHYGMILLITTLLGILSTYFSQRNVTHIVLEWFIRYRGIMTAFIIGVILIAGILAVNNFISYDFIILSITILIFTISIFFSNDITKRKSQFITMGAALLIACLVWTLFSYMSYYSGVRSALYQNQMLLFHSVKAVITSDLPEEIKIEKINDIAKSTAGEFTIEKDGKEILKKKSDRTPKVYLLESIQSKFDSDEYRLFSYNGSKYKLDFKYANKPYYSWGVIRAMTFSTFPDLLYGYSLQADIYFKNQNYARSSYFWGVFWVFYLMGLMWQYYRDRQEAQKKELIKLSQERKDALDKLQIAYSAYDHMHDEFDKVSLRDTRQQLQQLNLSWSEIVENVLADSRHTLKNKLQDQPLLSLDEMNRLDDSMQLFEQLIERGINVRLAEFRDTILVHQKELFKTIDYKTSLKNITEIVDCINHNIPKNYYDKERSGINFIVNDYINAQDYKLVCEVNLNRVASIVENLLKNASNALSYRDLDAEVLDDQIVLTYSIREVDSRLFFSVRVQDNAGGFPSHILGKIYKEPVESSDKTQKRMGKGSQYVKFFADRMNAIIHVNNVVNDKGEKGAEVELLVPIAEEE